jgi:hypothetical protein
VVADQLRLFGRDPPDQVVFAGEAVGVLQGELGLADPAHAVQRLHGHPASAPQGVVQVVEHAVATGEAQVAAGQVPYLRQRTRGSRTRLDGCGLLPRKGRRRCRQRTGWGRGHHPADGLDQHGDRLVGGQVEQIRHHDRRPQAAVQINGLDPQGNQLRVRVLASLREAGRPLVGGEPLRIEIGRRQQHQQRVVAVQCPVHRLDEVGARSPVDAVQLGRVPRGFQMPARPLRPRPVLAGV